MAVFENRGSASLCGRAKTVVFENDYVTGIGMSQLKKQNGCFLIRFRWSSVDGRKRCKNASVDEKLFIRFHETENGGFRKRISVDRAFRMIGLLLITLLTKLNRRMNIMKLSFVKCLEHIDNFRVDCHLARFYFTKSTHFFLRFLASVIIERYSVQTRDSS